MSVSCHLSHLRQFELVLSTILIHISLYHVLSRKIRIYFGTPDRISYFEIIQDFKIKIKPKDFLQLTH